MAGEDGASHSDETAALAEAVDLPVERKREILAREAALGRDHYAVLGLKPGASVKEVSAAYHEASRTFHPDRYFGKQLGSFQGRLERVFRRLAEAHATLVDDEKRDAYLRAHPLLRAQAAAAAPPPARTTATPEEALRQAERRSRLARHPYLARTVQAKSLVEEAKAELKSGAPERALGLLHKASQLDPRQSGRAIRDAAQAQKNAERANVEFERAKAAAAMGDASTAVAAYKAGLALEPHSPEAALAAAQLLYRAGDAVQARPLAQKAVELRPDHVPSLLLLGEVCGRLGMKQLAKRYLQTVLERDANNAAAKQLLKNLR